MCANTLQTPSQCRGQARDRGRPKTVHKPFDSQRLYTGQDLALIAGPCPAPALGDSPSVISGNFTIVYGCSELYGHILCRNEQNYAKSSPCTWATEVKANQIQEEWGDTTIKRMDIRRVGGVRSTGDRTVKNKNKKWTETCKSAVTLQALRHATIRCKELQ